MRGALLAAIALTLSLAACASARRQDDELERAAAGKTAAAQREFHRDLIRGMLDQGQYYAALAHIEEQKARAGATESLLLMEAEARRSLGQFDAADALYRRLLRGTLVANAYHGLGLLYAGRDLRTAVGHLQAAVGRQPANIDFRNDLGYALMVSGRYAEALPQLATAAELGPGLQKARNNLIILLILTGDEAGVRRMAAESGLTTPEVGELRRQAEALRASRRVQPRRA